MHIQTANSLKTCIVCLQKQRFYFSYQKYNYYKCTNCQLVTTFPYPNLKAIRSHYIRRFIDGNYNLLQTFSSEYKNVYTTFVTDLKRKLGRKLKKSKILDIGCFTGEFLELLSKEGADVYGIELQKEAARIANIKLPGRIMQANIDIDNVILPKKYYNVITMLGVIEHVVDPKKLLKFCSARTKEGGIVMIQTPNSASLLARIMQKYWPPYSPVEHIHLFNKRSLSIALEKEGFKIIYYSPHWKRLSITYVFNMFKNFGPEFHTLLLPLYKILPLSIRKLSLPFYIGEMVVIAKKM